MLDALGGLDGVRRALWDAAMRGDARPVVETAARALKRRDAAATAYEQAWDGVRATPALSSFPGGFVFDRLLELAADLPETDLVADPEPAGVTISAPYDRAPDAPQAYSHAADVPDLSAVMVRHNDPFVRSHKPGPSTGPVLDGGAPPVAVVDPADAEKRRRMGLG